MEKFKHKFIPMVNHPQWCDHTNISAFSNGQGIIGFSQQCGYPEDCHEAS